MWLCQGYRWVRVLDVVVPGVLRGEGAGCGCARGTEG